MAGDWIKMRVDLATSPKVVRIASALRADRLRVIGGLHAVWCLFDVHSTDGRLDGYTLEALDELIGFPGFGAAMVAVGWLEDDGVSLCTPRFDEHNGQSAKRRAMETERKREARKVSAPDADKVRSREEKRREEITPTTDVVGESAPKPRPARKCPEGFEVTPAMQDWATINAPLVNLDQATATFRDHTFNTAITDWAGAWRNWMRREQQYTTDRQRPGARPVVNRQEAIEQRNRAVAEEWLASQGADHAAQ